MGTFQYGGIMEQVAVVATSGTTDTLTNVSKQIRVYTGTVNQLIILPNATTFNEAGAKYEFYNTSTGTLTVEANGGATLASVSPNTSLILKLSSNGTSAGTWVQQATSAAQSGTKNYLSAYTASTASGTANTGNGNFESGSTTGWSLAHTSLSSLIPNSVATAGTPFSASAGGSAASGNLSITTVTAGTQIAGTYSGSLASSAASVAGDLLISSAFFIDKEDQAKVMQIKMYYQVATVGGLNFSGSSANGFAVYIYDVTNGGWIQPAGVYNFTQNSGTGYLTATFQTTSNSTQYQIALVNINASTGAYTMYLDDISVGPQIAPSGPAMTDWGNQAWTPTGSWVTNTTYTGKWRRVGDSMEADVFISLTGAPTATGLSINMPSGLSIDTTKVANSGIDSTIVGSGLVVQAGLAYPITVVEIASSTTIRVGTQTTVSGTNPQPITDAIVTNTVPITFASGATVAITFRVPIVGWSSNSSMSADTDTRVAAFFVQGSSNTNIGSSPTTLTFSAGATTDTHSGWNGSTTYTIPVAGIWALTVSGVLQTPSSGGGASGTQNWIINKNGSQVAGMSSQYGTTYAGVANFCSPVPLISYISCKAGDLITVQTSQNAGGTTGPNSSESYFSCVRLTGPAVVSATESVNAKYYITAAQSIASGASQTQVVWDTKSFDTHNAMNTSTGLYTCPVAGKYSVKVFILYASASWAVSPKDIILFKNGVDDHTMSAYVPAAAYTNLLSANVADTINCNGGDTLAIVLQHNEGSARTLSSGSSFVCIERIGN